MIITDMEAGLEHLSRATTRASDLMLVMAEPYYRSLETAGRVKALADELGIPKTYAIANKVRNPADAQAIQAFCDKRGLEIIATIPYDDRLAGASATPQAPLDASPDAAGVAAVAELAVKLRSLMN
jgi:CO dehydrogenase maturation factor